MDTYLVRLQVGVETMIEAEDPYKAFPLVQLKVQELLDSVGLKSTDCFVGSLRCVASVIDPIPVEKTNGNVEQ